MLTYLTQDPVSKELIQDCRKIALDQPLAWLNADELGFKTNGVSAGVVFVVYENQNLVACQHWGNIPGSRDSERIVANYVNQQLDYLSQALSQQNTDLSQFTIYAVGAQESSQNLINELKSRAKKQKFTFNTDNLHLVSGEDSFDFYVKRDSLHFIAQHHKEIIATASPAVMLSRYPLRARQNTDASDISNATTDLRKTRRKTHI